MGFTIPNTADASVAAQAAPDKVDIDILVAGLAGAGVVSGCAVTAQGSPNMTLAVASGVVTAGGTSASVAVASGNVTITTADATNPRFDLVVASTSTGTKSVVAGTAAASPVFPAVTAGTVALAAVYVAATASSIGSTAIVDKRVLVVDSSATFLPISTRTAVKTGNYTAVQGDIIPCDTSAGGFTVTLPNAPTGKAPIVVDHINAGASTILTVACAGSDVFDKASGLTSLTMPMPGMVLTLDYDLSTHVYTPRWSRGLSQSLNDMMLGPTGIDHVSFLRTVQSNQTQTWASGTMFLQALALPAGYPAGHLAALSIGAAVGPTHWWLALFDSSYNLLAITADQTSTAWGSNTLKSLAIANVSGGAASSYVIPTTGLYYVGVMMTAGTPCTFYATATSTGSDSISPIIEGTSTGSLTTPLTFPTTATAPSPGGKNIWVGVGR